MPLRRDGKRDKEIARGRRQIAGGLVLYAGFFRFSKAHRFIFETF